MQQNPPSESKPVFIWTRNSLYCTESQSSSVYSVSYPQPELFCQWRMSQILVIYFNITFSSTPVFSMLSLSLMCNRLKLVENSTPPSCYLSHQLILLDLKTRTRLSRENRSLSYVTSSLRIRNVTLRTLISKTINLLYSLNVIEKLHNHLKL
jgi:hypothetical protein